jgi:hypothetical protein
VKKLCPRAADDLHQIKQPARFDNFHGAYRVNSSVEVRLQCLPAFPATPARLPDKSLCARACQ